MERPHADGRDNEVRSKQERYVELSKKIGGPDPQVPTRADAERKVREQRERQRTDNQTKAKVVGTVKKDGTVQRTVPKASSETAAKPSQAKKPPAQGQQKKPQPTKARPRQTKTDTGVVKKTATARKKQNGQSAIQLPVGTFAALVLIIAVLSGAFIIQTFFIDRTVGASQSSPATAVSDSGKVTLTVEAGMNAREVAVALEKTGVITSRWDFERYLRQHDLDTRLQTGTFIFDQGQEIGSVAAVLTSTASEATVKNVRVYDGYTVRDIDNLLANQALAASGSFIKAAQEVATDNSLPFVEGWFLSGEYQVSVADAAGQLARAMLASLLTVVSASGDALEQLDRSLADVVVVASMVQRETQNPLEMPHIAAIIYKRLDAGWTLGIDASLRYALGVWDRPLSQADLEKKNPYNTRLTVGLPPTGIGSVGTAALQAALHPAENEWWYYLHDKDKTIHYAVTLEQHEANRKRYL